MDQVIMKKVLEDILDEQKRANEDKQQLIDALEQLTKQIRTFDSKLQSVRVNVPDIDTTNMEHVLKTHFQTEELYLHLHFKKDENLEKKKALKEQILYWILWLVIIALCAIIFRIAVGGNFHGTIF
jgi:ABC-type lipoprotein release transport system permease subunit